MSVEDILSKNQVFLFILIHSFNFAQEQLWLLFTNYCSVRDKQYSDTVAHKTRDSRIISSEDLWTLLRDFDVCPSTCSKHRLMALIGEINLNSSMPHDRTFSAPARATSGPRVSNIPIPSKIAVLVDSSPVRVVRNQIGRLSEYGMKQDFLDFHGFLKLLWRIASLTSTTESPGTSLSDTQRMAKLIFRMER